MSVQSIECVVMFADVAGSTALYENLGDLEARERITKALNTLISISKRHRGQLVKTIGDEILVYFLDADLALMAAQMMQETMEDLRSPETIGLSIRIGMHYGPIIVEEDDIFGDTVNVAARMVGMAKARQILCSGMLNDMAHSADMLEKLRLFDRIRLKGKEVPLDVYLLAWEPDADITNMATAGSFTNPARDTQPQMLELDYRGSKLTLGLDSETIQIGRGKDCDLIIAGDLISRFHARIEVRRGRFVITDQSTNGTFIRTEDGQNFFLRREENTLFGSGVISLGSSIEKAGDNLLHYRCI
jgi:class 3 adenylate cyclase